MNDRLRRSLIYFGLAEDPEPRPGHGAGDGGDDDEPLTRRQELVFGALLLLAFAAFWGVAELIGIGLGTDVLLSGEVLLGLLVVGATFLPDDDDAAPSRSIPRQVARSTYAIALFWFLLLALSRVFGNEISTDDLVTVVAVIAGFALVNAARLALARRREA